LATLRAAGFTSAVVTVLDTEVSKGRGAAAQMVVEMGGG